MTLIGDPMTTPDNPTLRDRLFAALDNSGHEPGLDLGLLTDAALSVIGPELDRLKQRYELASEDSDRIAQAAMQVEAQLRAERDQYKTNWDRCREGNHQALETIATLRAERDQARAELAFERDPNRVGSLKANVDLIARLAEEDRAEVARLSSGDTGWAEAMTAMDAWALWHADRAERHGDESAHDAYASVTVVAQASIADPDRAKREIFAKYTGDTPTPDEDPDVIVDATRVLRGTYCVFDESKERWWRPARAEVDRIVGALSSAGLLRAPAPQPEVPSGPPSVSAAYSRTEHFPPMMGRVLRYGMENCAGEDLDTLAAELLAFTTVSEFPLNSSVPPLPTVAELARSLHPAPSPADEPTEETDRA